MKLITLTWRERGYARETFWATTEGTAAAAIATTRQMVREARANCGVHGVRVLISNHPTKS